VSILDLLRFAQSSNILQYEDRAFSIVNDTYVTSLEGTGIVHQAPAFGEDDHRIAIASGILQADEQPPCPIDDAGRFTVEVVDFVGQYVKVSLHLVELVLCHKPVHRMPTKRSGGY
jgi:isoleucyl-tRNA synthetase